MRLLLLADINSPHTKKWVDGLAPLVKDIGLFSLRTWQDGYELPSNVKILFNETPSRKSWLGKLNNYKLFTYHRRLKQIVKSWKPDLLHAHNVSQYGLVGALSKCKPMITSAYGSDIMDHPKRSTFHLACTKYALRHSNKILATSQSLAEATKNYTDQDVKITSFGVDTTIFKPSTKPENIDAPIIFGSVKSLKQIYRHDVSIRAFAKLLQKYPERNLYFKIVGGGLLLKELKLLTSELGVTNQVVFVGSIAHEKIPAILQQIDIFVNVPNTESFGVSVLEASACGKPVIASSAGGLLEVVKDLETGFLITPGHIDECYLAMEKLMLSQALRQKMGVAGRQFVIEKYSWANSVQTMMGIYKSIVPHV